MGHSSRTRREFVAGIAGAAGILSGCRTGASTRGSAERSQSAAEVTLRIAPVELEVSPRHIINTVGYNGAAPGPIVRFREGQSTEVEIINDTVSTEFVHWHGFDTPVDVDGAEEEGSLAVPPRKRVRYRMTPLPSGCRYVHTHSMAMGDLDRGTFTGQFAFCWVEPRQNPGRYDQEIFLATHEWVPYLTYRDAPDDCSPEERESPKKEHAGNHGREVEYRYFTINGKCLGFGEPIRVKEGQRVLFHFLNASATENVRLALPGHRFQVVALDGNPVPQTQLVDVLELGTAERIDAVVKMDSPGVYILGTPNDEHRSKGLGIVVEYANRSGPALWTKPPKNLWDYTMFGENRRVAAPDRTIPLVIRVQDGGSTGFEQWTINGRHFAHDNVPVRLERGRSHCLVFDNRTDDLHPVHLHRASFELVDVAGTPTAGIMKDVVVLRKRSIVKVHVTPTLAGLALFHCHQQLHMDNGFKMLFNVT